MSADVDAVLGTLPAEGLVEGVRQDDDGLIHSVIVDETAFPELTARMRGASAAAIVSAYAGEAVHLFTAVMPDDDGILRARWRTEPTPGDREWARHHPEG